MDDATTELTMDQAMEVLDEPRDNLPAERPETVPYDEGTLEFPIGHQPSSDGSLTLDEATAIDLADEAEAPETTDGNVPAVIIDHQPVSMKQLVDGYHLGKRIVQHANNLAEQYMAVQDASRSLVSASWELSGYMVNLLPQEPSNVLLATNPVEYSRQKAQHEHAYEQMTTLLQRVMGAKSQADNATYLRHGQLVLSENEHLIQHFPETADPVGRERFFDRMREVAYACDFSEEEMRQVVDHRIFRLADLAVQGLEALQRRDQKRVSKRRRSERKRHSEAFERLARTGSMDDAMAVDFD